MAEQDADGLGQVDNYTLTIVVDAKFQRLGSRPNPTLQLESTLSNPENVDVFGKYAPVEDVCYFKITFFDTTNLRFLTDLYNVKYNVNSTPVPINGINCCEWQMNVENSVSNFSEVMPSRVQFSNLKNVSATKYVPNATMTGRHWSANLTATPTNKSAVLTIKGFGVFSPQVLKNPPNNTVFVVLRNVTQTDAVVSVTNTSILTEPTLFDPYGQDSFTIPSYGYRQYVATPSSLFTVLFTTTLGSEYIYTFAPSQVLNELTLLPTTGHTVGSATGKLVALDPTWTYFQYRNDFTFLDNPSDVDPAPPFNPPPEPSPPPRPAPSPRPPRPAPSPNPSPPNPSPPNPSPPNPSPNPSPPNPSPNPSPNPTPPPPNPNPSSKSLSSTIVIVIVVVAVVLVLAGILTALFVHKHKPTKTVAKT